MVQSKYLSIYLHQIKVKIWTAAFAYSQAINKQKWLRDKSKLNINVTNIS